MPISEALIAVLVYVPQPAVDFHRSSFLDVCPEQVVRIFVDNDKILRHY